MIRHLAAAAALCTLALTPAAQAQDISAPAPAADKPAVPEGPQDSMVAIDGGGDALLYGALLRPGNGSYPTVIILPAQGSDHDGNSSTDGIKSNTYKMLAQDLAAKGIASLRIDKRGVGASYKAIGREEDLRFDTYVEDAVSWIKFMKTQPHVNCLAVLGHAEGALVAALATQKIKVCALIEMSGSGRPAAAMLAEQLKVANQQKKIDQPLYDEAIKTLNSLSNGKTVAQPSEKLNALFRPSVQPYLISWLDLNPVEALKQAPPTLILQGSRDYEIGQDDAQKLATAPKYAKVVIVSGADHDMKVVPAASKTANRADDAAQPVSPQASTAIADFLKRLKWP
jgi:pimeloyl-ACP methyl ester carboxylesterase